MKILGNSDISNVALSFASGENSLSKQKQREYREQDESPPSSLPLQRLVALASSLFDEATLKEKQIAQEQQKREQLEGQAQEDELKREPLPPVAINATRNEPQTNITRQKVVTSVDSTTIQKPLIKKTENQPINVQTSSISRNQDLNLQHSNIHCCTREGFLSRLRAVLNDASRSNVLSWMPNGKAFTIVSSRKFAKTGLVYELFGIRKMSSFLRRLNQLGFARVRDPTDPQNLDVFRKPGFEASSAIAEKPNNASAATSNKAHSLESPTSTPLIVQKTVVNDEDTSEEIPRNPMDLSMPGSSFVFGRGRTSSCISSASSITTTSTLTASSVDSTMTTSTPASASWACSTPDIRKSSQSQSLEIDRSLSIPNVIVQTNRIQINHPPLSWVSMPPSMPASSSGGPVLLRARSESHDGYVSTPPLASSSLAPLLPPPKLALQSSTATSKTPKTANRGSMELSPETLQSLKVPNLVNDSDSDASTISMYVDNRLPVDIMHPPQVFIDEFMKQVVHHPSKQTPIPMEVEREAQENWYKSKMYQQNFRHSQRFGMIGAEHCLRLQHQREYISLWQVADMEADAVLHR